MTPIARAWHSFWCAAFICVMPVVLALNILIWLFGDIPDTVSSWLFAAIASAIVLPCAVHIFRKSSRRDLTPGQVMSDIVDNLGSGLGEWIGQRADFFILACFALIVAPMGLGFWQLALSIYTWAKDGLWFHPSFGQWLSAYNLPLPSTEWRGVQSVFDWFFDLPSWVGGIAATLLVALIASIFIRDLERHQEQNRQRRKAEADRAERD